MKVPSPDALLRFSVVICLIAFGAISIKGLEYPVSPLDPFFGSFTASTLFGLSMAMFSFFYIEYLFLPLVTKRGLNPWLGYLQASGCLTIVFYGASRIVVDQTAPFAGVADAGHLMTFANKVLLDATVFGQAIFILNAIWSHFRGEIVAVDRKSVAAKFRGTWAWPSSPVKLFGFTAVFLLAGGFATAFLGGPSRLPATVWGHSLAVPLSGLWILAAAPFAIFALLYRHFTRDHPVRKLDESMTRVHFILTILGVAEATGLYISWQASAITGGITSIPRYESSKLLAFLALVTLSVTVFIYNIVKSHRSPLVSSDAKGRSTL